MKSFFLGVVCGAGVVAAAGWLWIRNDGVDLNPDREPEVAPANIPDNDPLASATSQGQDEIKPSTERATVCPAEVKASADSASAMPGELREDFMAEPKDDSWAYYMEQTLLQYLSGHSSIAQFDIRSIECRTTKCQIEVVGYDESTVPVWQQVMYDIGHQPWSDFGQYGTSSGIADDRLVIIGTLQRVPVDDEI